MKWLRKLWQDFGDGPEWRTIAFTYLIGAAAAGTGGAFAENRWLMFIDALLAGWCLHGALSARMIKVYRDLLERTRTALHDMQDLNKAMLEDKVRMHLAKVEIAETDDGPAKTIN